MTQAGQENRPQIIDQAPLDFSARLVREVCQRIGSRLSMVVHLPDERRRSFASSLSRIFSEKIRLYQSAEAPDIAIRVIDPQSPEFITQLDQLAKNKLAFTGKTFADYLRQFSEINIWINIDEIELAIKKIEDDYYRHREAFLHALKFGQSMFVFDHQYDFQQLLPHIQEKLGACEVIFVKTRKE